MNDKSLEERTIYDGPKNNERVNVTKALERLYGCILNKKKDKMKFFVCYEKKETLRSPYDISPCYYADLFVYKENSNGMFAHLKISKKKLWELGKLGVEIRPHSERRKSYRYGNVILDHYSKYTIWEDDPPGTKYRNYFSEITIRNVKFTLKRTPLETNAEIKERKAKERLEELHQLREEEEKALYKSCMSKSRLG